ncbi:MAG: hypothetical protein ABSG05_00865 [Candidatus Pacearchaeota archaeon]|jgi:hypothetical protein
MGTKVQIGSGPSMPIEDLERILSEARKIESKKIKRNRKLIEQAGNPVPERQILVHYDSSSPNLGYSVDDILPNGQRPIKVGEAEYRSSDLRGV